jgi:hypothetical protein
MVGRASQIMGGRLTPGTSPHRALHLDVRSGHSRPEGNRQGDPEYEDRYGKNWGTFGPPAYVSVQALLTAMNKSCKDKKSSRAEVLKNLRTTRLPNTILGLPVQFDGKGQNKFAKFYIYKIIVEADARRLVWRSKRRPIVRGGPHSSSCDNLRFPWTGSSSYSRS